MPWNINAGYGRLLAEAISTHRPYTGKMYFVATSSLAGWEEFSEMFPVGPEGNTRVWGTLKELLDADMIEDGGDDVIYVHPNHTETINAAAGIDTGTDSAGLTIIGLGSGDERPLFTFATATTADLDIGSNGVTIENIRFDLTGVDALAAPIDVNDSGFTIKNCEFIVADSTGQAVVAMLTDANANKMTVDGCDFIGSQTTGTKSAIRIVGGSDSKIINNRFIGNYKITAGAIEVTTTAAGNLRIEDNTILNTTAASTTAINFVRGTTSVLVGNVLGIKSGTTPIKVEEGVESVGACGGYLLVGKNYYNASSTVTAGTLI